jgi:branched-subunit amino acid ABC-type transport system permease component
MPPGSRTRFREQAEGALVTLAGTVTYLLFQVARRTEVRTEGDRVLVVACAIGAIATAAVLVVIAVRGALRRRRERAAADGRAVDARDDESASGS